MQTRSDRNAYARNAGLPEDFTSIAENVWADYLRTNDVSTHVGEIAAIEPNSRVVWFGRSGAEIEQRMLADGIDSPVYLVRVGSDHFVRKG